jgi:hypothetical protein
MTTIASSVGTIFLAQTLSSIAYGITILQAFFYFAKYSSEDRFLLKLTVALSTILDTAHMLFGLHLTWFYTVIAYANIEMLQKVVW